MKERALIVASVASHIKQFCMDDADTLMELGYSVDIAANFRMGNAIDEESLKDFQKQLVGKGIAFYQIDFTRSMMNLKSHYASLKSLQELIEQNHYEIVHCHTPIAGAICRVAAKRYRTEGIRVLYTAHGFHFYKGAPLKNWLLFYPVEKLCSKWTDVLIVINKEDYALAKRSMKAKAIEYIPGVGVDLTRFYPNKYDKTTITSQRKALGLDQDDVMLLSVGELTPRKNHKVVIQALAELSNPHLKYYICGCGQLEDALKKFIESLGLVSNVFLLGYRQDVDLLYACADLFVFPSLQEGLPVALMEALASGLPAIGSDVRGNNELLDQHMRFPVSDIPAIKSLINAYIYDGSSNDEKSTENRIRAYGKKIYLDRIKQIYIDLGRG